MNVHPGGGAVTLHLGLDLGGTNVKCAVVERDGGEPRVLATDACATGAAAGPDAVLARVGELGRATVAPYGEPATAGLALPGHFDAERGTGVLLPNLRGDWAGRPIAAPVGERLGLPVTLVNDVRALTLAELRLGAGRGARDLVCIALGTGVGGGVADAGELLLGPLREEVRRRACVAPVHRIQVVAAALGPYAGAVGAALWSAEPAGVRTG